VKFIVGKKLEILLFYIIKNIILALVKYEEFLNSKDKKLKEKIKADLLEYNRDDLKRTKFIYDQLKELE